MAPVWMRVLSEMASVWMRVLSEMAPVWLKDRMEEFEMWVCPKCGRTFKKENQSHYCGKAPETIGQYIEAQPEEAQPYLLEVRKAIRDAVPEAQERISWSMPTFLERT